MTGPVYFTMPDPAIAPGYRDALNQMSALRVQDFGDTVAVEPEEGAGQVRQMFTAHRLCDSESGVDWSTWEPVRDNPPREHAPERVGRLLEYAERLAAQPAGDLPSQLQALSARVVALGPQLPAFLQEQAPRLFETLPGASLWWVQTDDVLLGRLALLRTRLGLQLTPDLPMSKDEFEGLRLLGGHSVSSGTTFSPALVPATLAFSPGLSGVVLPAPPHSLVLFFGQNLELRRPQGQSINELLQPRLLAQQRDWDRHPMWRDVTVGEAEAALVWWVDRMNVIYSHASDPTCFANALGQHDPAAQMAWLLTFERALADLTFLLSEPRQPELISHQTTFDLLDKCENLLGYSRSGPGFKELLRRSRTAPRLREAWSRLPTPLDRRFRRGAHAAFEGLYDGIRDHALAHRLTKRGVLVASDDPSRLRPMSMDDYVSRLVRVVRNSAHGLSRPLRDESGLLVATHDGVLPPELADVAALVFYGLVADAERLCAGDWW